MGIFKSKEIKQENKLSDLSNLDINTLLFKTKIELSDTIFEQHQLGCYRLNMIIITIQFIMFIIGVIGSIFGLHISNTTCCISIILLGLVMINNIIHNKAWNKAKSRLNQVELLLDLLKTKVETKTINELEMKYNLHFNDSVNKKDKSEV